MKNKAFTLAEVLITLMITGVIAAMVIPVLMQNMQDYSFQVAYRKAYSDMSQAFSQAIQDGSLIPRPSTYYSTDATASEWAVMKEAFKIAKECQLGDLNSCWAEGDKIYKSIYPVSNTSYSFIDAAGRSWAEYKYDENLYLVDTNGFKPPNRFGKDRWIFALKNADNTGTGTGLPAKMGIYYRGDVTTSPNDWCNYTPCYYYSWLYK